MTHLLQSDKYHLAEWRRKESATRKKKRKEKKEEEEENRAGVRERERERESRKRDWERVRDGVELAKRMLGRRPPRPRPGVTGRARASTERSDAAASSPWPPPEEETPGKVWEHTKEAEFHGNKVIISSSTWIRNLGFMTPKLGVLVSEWNSEKLIGLKCLLSSVIDDYSLRLRIDFEFLVLDSFWPNVWKRKKLFEQPL